MFKVFKDKTDLCAPHNVHIAHCWRCKSDYAPIVESQWMQKVGTALTATGIFFMLLLTASLLTGCGHNHEDISKVEQCSSKCSPRDVKVFWQSADYYGTVSTHCECL